MPSVTDILRSVTGGVAFSYFFLNSKTTSSCVLLKAKTTKIALYIPVKDSYREIRHDHKAKSTENLNYRLIAFLAERK